MKEVVIFTDGACRGNPGPGGWGVVLRFGTVERELCGGEAPTTNNRMELMAAIRGLEALRESCKVQLFTDSEYVRRGITEWMSKWRVNGWRTADRKPVKNADLWRELDAEAARHSVSWHWVKGHAGHPDNERADALANRGLEESLLAPVSGRKT